MVSDGIPVAGLDHNSWIENQKAAWDQIKDKKDNDSDVLHFFKSVVDHVADLHDTSSANDNPNVASIGVIGLEWIGMNAYSAGTLTTAEIAFRILAECGSTSGKNNYAYMIRRREVSNPNRFSPLTAIQLLRSGVQEREAYSLVNMALIFSLCLGTDADWHIAEELMGVLPVNDTMGVLSWWSDVARKGDLEGYLVHFFLLRHHNKQSSDLGTIDVIRDRLVNGNIHFPKWLINET